MSQEAIFIGYRRDDTADVAGRIYDALAARFGRERVFKDVDSIGPGVEFGAYIKGLLPRCRIALVLIGPHWLDARDETGARRLDDPSDWVRTEVETALATPDVLLIPVLVNGAPMPRPEQLPESLRPLIARNAAQVRRDPDFQTDVERLVSAMRESVPVETRAAEKKSGSWVNTIGIGVAASAIALAAALTYSRIAPQPSRGAHPPSPASSTPAVTTRAADSTAKREASRPPNREVKAHPPSSASKPIVGAGRGTIEEWTAWIGDGRIYFDADSSRLEPAALAAIQEQAAWLVANPEWKVRIEGHAPPEGLTKSAAYLMGMSGRRADAVKDALTAAGVDPARITTMSYGSARLRDPGSSGEAIAKSRFAQVVPYRE